MQWDDTIVALATPPGISAIGVVRLSGKKAIQIVNGLFPSKDLVKQESHTIHVGYLKEKEKGKEKETVIDEVVVSLFKAPRSYTGEDVVEISGHGSPFVLQQVLESVLRAGARMAKPGEFTQRAFLSGKLDLTQAEAVADLIASNTEASQRTALNNIRGGFSHALQEMREKLIRFSALIELELDFSQEDVEFADRTSLINLINELTELTGRLVKSFRLGNVIRNGVSVAIIGRPNAGKSTLLNSLLNENRAIVSEIAGTTRDTIEEVINIDGILFRLIDTAGIREHTSDLIETMGVERSKEKMEKADVVVYLFDAAEASSHELRAASITLEDRGLNHILAVNKIDLLGEKETKEKFSGISNIVFISAKEHRHTEVLKEKLVDSVLQGDVKAESTIVTNARHYHALKEVEKSLVDIREGLNKKIAGDLLAIDIRRCLHYLGEITGEITNEDQLDYIFSKFCIGK